MKRMLVRWFIGVMAIVITVFVAQALNTDLVKLKWDPAWKMIIFVPVFAIVSAVIGPILQALALPLNCLTFGLFGFVIGVFMFYAAGAVTGAQMSFLGALFGSIVFSIISAPLNALTKERRN